MKPPLLKQRFLCDESVALWLKIPGVSGLAPSSLRGAFRKAGLMGENEPLDSAFALVFASSLVTDTQAWDTLRRFLLHLGEGRGRVFSESRLDWI